MKLWLLKFTPRAGYQVPRTPWERWLAYASCSLANATPHTLSAPSAPPSPPSLRHFLRWAGEKAGKMPALPGHPLYQGVRSLLTLNRESPRASAPRRFTTDQSMVWCRNKIHGGTIRFDLWKEIHELIDFQWNFSGYDQSDFFQFFNRDWIIRRAAS